MKIRILNALLLATLALTFAGCGGGGTPAPAVTTVVNGVVSKGIIKNGTVKVYAVNADGSKGSLLASVSSDDKGEYTANLAYAGPILVEASGTYTDEATGQPVTVPADKPLHAALDNAIGSVTVAVTPLTELAFQKAGTALTPANIKAANALVSDLFNVDIINTKPVEPVKAVLDAATKEQKDYTLALATISKMASGTSVAAVISTLKTDIAANNDSMSAATAGQFTTALNNFLSDTQHNQTGETTPPPNLANIGTKTAVVRLSVQGVATATVYGTDATIDLPAGVTVHVKNAASGEVADDALAASGVATSGSSLVTAKYSAAAGTAPATIHIALINSGGFGAGEVITLKCDIAPGATVSTGGFTVEAGAIIKDGTGIAVSGASVTLAAVM
jgi:hypothetical protein